MADVQHCPKCGHEIRKEDAFCASCGMKIQTSVVSKICETCGRANTADSMVCVACGTSLEHEAERTPSQKSHTERRASEALSVTSLIQKKIIMLAFGIIAFAIIVYEITQAPDGEIVRANTSQQQTQNPASPQTEELLPRIKELEEHLKAVPNDQQAMLELANRLHDAHFFPRAIEAYKKYLTANPKDVDARVDMGICYFENGNFERAVLEIESALKLSPKHQMAMFNLGVMYLNQDNLEKSNEWLKKCSELDPSTEVGKKALQILNQHKLN